MAHPEPTRSPVAVAERPTREFDVASSTGFSLHARSRLLLTDVRYLSSSIPLRKVNVDSLPAQPVAAYSIIQHDWNTERKKVTTPKERWAQAMAQASMSLLKTTTNQEAHLVGSILGAWGIPIIAENTTDLTSRMSKAFEGEFYDMYCGVGQEAGLQRLGSQLVLGVMQYTAESQKVTLDKVLGDPVQLAAVGTSLKDAQMVLSNFLERYFGNAQILHTFELCTAAQFTSLCREFYSSNGNTIGPLSRHEESIFSYLSSQVPNIPESLTPHDDSAADEERKRKDTEVTEKQSHAAKQYVAARGDILLFVESLFRGGEVTSGQLRNLADVATTLGIPADVLRKRVDVYRSEKKLTSDELQDLLLQTPFGNSLEELGGIRLIETQALVHAKREFDQFAIPDVDWPKMGDQFSLPAIHLIIDYITTHHGETYQLVLGRYIASLPDIIDQMYALTHVQQILAVLQTQVIPTRRPGESVSLVPPFVDTKDKANWML